MTQAVHGSGATLVDAVGEAIAALLHIDADDVDIRLPRGAAAEFTGEATMALTVTTPPARASRQSRPKAAPEPPAEATQQADTPAPSPADIETVDAEPIDLDAEADAAADFLEGLLDALDLPGDLKIKIHDEHAEIEIVELGDGALIGRRGQTLEAVQELVRSAMQREFQRRSRILVDVEGYRARRLEKLQEKAEEAIDEVLDTGEAVRLEPMDSFERKAIHRLVAEVDGVESRSQGRDPSRRVVIEPA